MTALTFTVPVLPDRMLSSNAGNRSRRNPWAVAEARGRLKNDTMEALKDLQPLPAFVVCVADVTLHRTNKRPKVEQCPRCLLRALEDRSVDGCCCYRPRDVGNIGGDVLKPVLDGLVWMEVLPDDDYRHLTAVTLRIGEVETLAEECIEVTVREIEGAS